MAGDHITATHWGVYRPQVEDGRVVSLAPFEHDPDPSPIGRSMPGALTDACRISQPHVRAGYLEKGWESDRTARGAEPFVPVGWDEALDLVSRELVRVREAHGNEAIFAGSYGWASAGRFHNAPAQLHRFMNLFGGFTGSVNSYSFAAAEVAVPHLLGSLGFIFKTHTGWPVIAEHSDLVVCFGGLPLKNAQISPGGVGAHTTAAWLRRCRERGVAFVNFSPLRDDAADFLEAEWHQLRPNTDTAVMLGIAHTLLAEGLHDRAFLERYCVGFERFEAYLAGADDGLPKDADWAAAISGVDAEVMRDLARRMAAGRTLVNASWSLQRAEHGEQPYWMLVTLAAMLGQLGLPGGGLGMGYAAVNGIGNPAARIRWASLRRGENPVTSVIPVSRIADMLLGPGESLDYNGRRITFPHIRAVYWAGGNPFHHHQDINRLLEAWRRPETVIVHEIWWNALARHADIVLPATTVLERNDIVASTDDAFAVGARRAAAPIGEARNDHDIFAALAGRLGFAEAFTEGRSEMDWLRHLYDISRQQAARAGVELPDFEAFWRQGYHQIPPPEDSPVLLAEFRADPEVNALRTPSGRIELFSATVAGFGYDDCPGHAVWLEPTEWLGAELAGRFPLHLISNQPRTRLHSQLDNGAVSRESKVAGREPIRINPGDAAPRGIADGDVVRVFNDRGACLAGAEVSDGVMAGVVQLATGAWYDPIEPGRVGSLDRHGNPNMLTMDKGASRLSQGPSAQSALVEVERFEGELPDITVFGPPPIAARGEP